MCSTDPPGIWKTAALSSESGMPSFSWWGVLPPFLEVSCGVKTLDCGVGSEAVGRRQMNRDRTFGPGERKRPSLGDHRLAGDFSFCLCQWHFGAFERVAEFTSYLQWFLLLKQNDV